MAQIGVVRIGVASCEVVEDQRESTMLAMLSGSSLVRKNKLVETEEPYLMHIIG